MNMPCHSVVCVKLQTMFELMLVTILCNFLLGSSRVINGTEDHNIAMENEELFDGDMLGIDFEDRNALTNPKDLWPNGILYYVIDQSLAKYTKVIHGAMAEYTKKTGGCITFKSGKGQGNYLYIGKYKGCNSYVGMIGGRQRVSLGQGCQYHGVVLHELGHAIGMFHEQNRSDRDKYVRILTQNINKAYRFAFKKVHQDKNYLFTAYDYGSIMQYPKKAFSTNGLDTIEPIFQTSVFGQSKALSNGDVTTVMSLYNCAERAAKPLVPAKTSKPLMHCGFEHGFCVFKNVVLQALFVRRHIKGHYYLQTNTPGLDHRLESIPLRYYGTGTICITIQYFSRGSVPICEFGIITGAQNVTRIKLAATSEWQLYSKTVMGLKPNYQFRVYFDARPEDESSFSLGYFNYREGECKN